MKTLRIIVLSACIGGYLGALTGYAERTGQPLFQDNCTYVQCECSNWECIYKCTTHGHDCPMED